MEYKKGDMVMLLDTPPDYNCHDVENFKKGRIGKVVEANGYSDDYAVGVCWQGGIAGGHTCEIPNMPYSCWRVPKSIIKKII